MGKLAKLGLTGLLFISGCGGFEVQFGETNAGRELQNPENIALVRKKAEALINKGDYRSLSRAYGLYQKELASQPESCAQRKYIGEQLVNSEKPNTGAALLRQYEIDCCDQDNCDQK